jgi:hypothetical protein
MPVLLDGRALCQLREVVPANDFEVEVDINGSITSWFSVSHPGVPSQVELDAAEAAINADPSLCFEDPIVPLDTDDLPEGSSNLYYTNTRVSANVDVVANTASRHDPVTLGSGNDPRVTLSGQEITADLSDLDDALTDISALQGQSHDPASLATGVDPRLSLAGQEFDLDLTDLDNAQTDIITLQSQAHDLVSLGGSNDPRLVLSNQELTLDLTDLDTAQANITALQSQAHDPATAAPGGALSETGQEFSITLDPDGDNVLTQSAAGLLAIVPSVAPELPILEVALTNGQSLNSAVYGTLTYSAILVDEGVGATINVNGSLSVPIGRYFAICQLGLSSLQERTNIGMRLYNDTSGFTLIEVQGSGYIRGLDGHNEASTIAVGTFFQPNDTDEILVQTRRLANAGTVNLVNATGNAQSRLILMRVGIPT